MKTSQQIRKEFIAFFESKGHRYVRSSPVVPPDDPTLLFSNAGMNQFKDIFLGTGIRDYNRAANSQKCIRASGKHNDLEDVGRDNFHHTFFEMLGNWSFGDYFKKEAITWAWELFTEHWNLPQEKLWATVFEGSPAEGVEADNEAENYWKTCTSINPEQILNGNKKDNFWEMGEVGPCGPCSEIHIDLGEGTCSLSEKHDCAVNVEGCERFIELWNLVFVQYNRLSNGTLEPLPSMHVDTGMGLERICRVLQEKDSNYSTDLFTPLLDAIATITGTPDGKGEIGVAFRVIADHLRSLSFAIADGAIPSNEGRGYVLRRMLRRATRFGRLLGMHSPFIYKLVPTLAETMGEAFPEIVAQAQHVAGVIKSEEESFGLTLDRGLDIFEQMVNDPQAQKEKQLSGKNAFKLYDTYGFPLDLTRLMCEERQLTVDEDEFNRSMEEQRTRARESAKFKATLEDWHEVHPGEQSRFVGYQNLSVQTKLLKFNKNDKGQWVMVLDETSFYAESGGQVADRGTIRQGERTWKVLDVQKDGDFILHICKGDATPDDAPITTQVDAEARLATTYNHTATHLLQSALRQVVGTHVNQAGSVVHPDYLRFDLTHFEKLSEDQLEALETLVNQKIRENIPLNIYETSYDQAVESGVTALFGEKYGDQVRVVQASDYSNELCGGCHVQATGEIGTFRIQSEAGIAAGVRRITAITGPEAEVTTRAEGKALNDVRQLLNVPTEKISPMLAQLLDEKRQLEKELRTLKQESAAGGADQLLAQAQEISGVKVLISELNMDSMDSFKSLGDSLRGQLNPGLAVLAANFGGKLTFLCVVSDALVQKKIKAGEVINLVAALADGRGGGKPHMAQAGAKSPEKLPEALQQAPALIENYLQGRL